jgi:SsrA-binding protein
MKTIAKNKKALHDYYVEEKIEAGVVLKGSEVKALRLGHGSIADGYAVVRDGLATVVNFMIPTLKQASYMNHSERREKRLLLKASEIRKLDQATRQRGYTLIPLEVYFNDANIVKIELGLCRGKAQHDKRESAKVSDAKREMDRAVRR